MNKEINITVKPNGEVIKNPPINLKFKQICSVAHPERKESGFYLYDVTVTVYGLDEDGQVWKKVNDKKWVRESMEQA